MMFLLHINANAQEKGPRSEKLQVLFVKSISNEECESKSDEYVDESHLCTISPKKQGMCGVSSSSFYSCTLLRTTARNILKKIYFNVMLANVKILFEYSGRTDTKIAPRKASSSNSGK